jgi:hypothetical protein
VGEVWKGDDLRPRLDLSLLGVLLCWSHLVGEDWRASGWRRLSTVKLFELSEGGRVKMKCVGGQCAR